MMRHLACNKTITQVLLKTTTKVRATAAVRYIDATTLRRNLIWSFSTSSGRVTNDNDDSSHMPDCFKVMGVEVRAYY